MIKAASAGLPKAPEAFLGAIADAIRNEVGGSSGICYDLALRAAANSVANDKEWTASES
jgi:hypothetical protein